MPSALKTDFSPRWQRSVGGPWGTLRIVGDDLRLWQADYVTSVTSVTKVTESSHDFGDAPQWLLPMIDEIEQRPGVSEAFMVYFAWDRVTAFAQAVLQETLRIPRGSMYTYGEVAARVGSPRAARAVGGALRRNPWPVLVPCHRVRATNALGGSAGARSRRENRFGPAG